MMIESIAVVYIKSAICERHEGNRQASRKRLAAIDKKGVHEGQSSSLVLSPSSAFSQLMRGVGGSWRWHAVSVTRLCF